MQEWINNKKNLPIVIALAAVIFGAALVFVLFQTGVLGGTPAATDASASATAPAAPAAAPVPPVAPVAPGAPAAPVVAAAPGTPAATTVAAIPVAGAPGARPDPFAGYVDYNTWLQNRIRDLPPPPRVDSFVPFVRITNYVPSTGLIAPLRPGGIPNLPPLLVGSTTTAQGNIGRVSGVMLTNGAFAIVDNMGQSSILQPGDQLPNGGGRVISIQADGITVHTTGDQTVKVPISAGDSTNTPNGPNGPYGPQGPPNIPGNAPDQGDNTNGG